MRTDECMSPACVRPFVPVCDCRHNEIVRTATRILLTEVVPTFAQYLLAHVTTAKQMETLRLSEECHRRGINIR